MEAKDLPPTLGKPPSGKGEHLLQKWHKGLRLLQVGNFRAATYYSKLGKRFGVFVVIITSVVSSAIFGTLGESEYKGLQLVAGLISVLGTVLSSLQTFLGYSERSASHKEAAVGYGELRTEVEMLLASDLTAISNWDKRVDSIRIRWLDVDKGAPTLPSRILADMKKEMGDDSLESVLPNAK